MSVRLKTYNSLFLLIVIIMICSLQTADSQSKTYTLEESETTDLKELVKYEETKRKLVPREFEQKKKKEEEKKEIKSIGSSGLGAVFQYVLYLGIIILVVVILIMLFSNIKMEKKLDEIEPLDLEDIEDIETIDAKSGLEIALEAENYREAVRMLFIQLLQVLVIEESIEWKPKKTNRDYLREMSDHEKVSHFRILVMAYERVWYGSQEIDRPFFDELRRDFERFYSTQDLKLGHAEEY